MREPKAHHYRIRVNGRGVTREDVTGFEGTPFETLMPSRFKTITLVCSAARKIADSYHDSPHVQSVSVIRYDRHGEQLPAPHTVACTFAVHESKVTL